MANNIKMNDDKKFIIKAPGKINLTLDVIKKNKSNFHEIDSLIIPWPKMFDLLTISFFNNSKKIMVKTVGKYAHHMPLNIEDNIVYKMLKSLQTKVQFPSGIKVIIHKQTPVGIGCGIGSSQIANLLKFLNKYWKLQLTEIEMINFLFKISKDAPFFLYYKPARIQGEGEKVSILNDDLKNKLINYFSIQFFYFENIFLSTKKVFAQKKINKKTTFFTKNVIDALDKSQYYIAAKNFKNDLLEPAMGINAMFKTKYNEINGKIQQKNQQNSELLFLNMSGSGSSIYTCKINYVMTRK